MYILGGYVSVKRFLKSKYIDIYVYSYIYISIYSYTYILIKTLFRGVSDEGNPEKVVHII